MDEQIFSDFPQGFTKTLQEYCKAPGPDQSFISGLEQELLEHQAVLLRAQPVPAFPRSSRIVFSSFLFTRRNWRYTVLLLLVALTVALFLVGPQRVLAQVQHWLGYVPGIGFVDLQGTRVLANPVEISRDGVTLRVEHVIAARERTEIVISVPGLVEGDLPWPNEGINHQEFTAFLLLQDGSRLETTSWALNLGAAKLEFPPLPLDVHRLTLIVPRLPLAPEGSFPEQWEVPLILRSATNNLSEELFPQPYSPVQSSDTHHGITVRVLNVAQTSSETAINYQVEWNNPEWESRFGVVPGPMPELRDNLGHIYWESFSPGSSIAVAVIPAPSDATPTPPTPHSTGMLVFPALSVSASEVLLSIESLDFWVTTQESFHLDIGPSPKIGDSWPLDINLEVAGFPVHLTEAYLHEKTVDLGDGTSEQRTVLNFRVDAWGERDGFRLIYFGLANPEGTIFGSASPPFPDRPNVYEVQLEFPAGQLPSGTIELTVTDARLMAQGPWEVTWEIPGKSSAEVARPVHLFPKSAESSNSTIQPVVDEVFLSDRLTAIKVRGAGLPAGATFVQALTYNPSGRQRHLYLEDNWGRRYQPGMNQAILRPNDIGTGYDPSWQFFAPLQPLVQRFSLHIPAMEVFLPASTSFKVQVPSDLTFEQEDYTVTTIGGGGPARQETQTRQVSDPWQVDISLEVAGYKLRFTEAQVQYDTNTDPPYFLVLKGKPTVARREDLHLNELRFSRVEQPDGTILQIKSGDLNTYPYGGVGPVGPYSNQLQATIILNVTDGRDALLSGEYHVEISGVTSWISGPWELPISLSGK